VKILTKFLTSAVESGESQHIAITKGAFDQSGIVSPPWWEKKLEEINYVTM